MVIVTYPDSCLQLIEWCKEKLMRSTAIASLSCQQCSIH